MRKYMLLMCIGLFLGFSLALFAGGQKEQPAGTMEAAKEPVTLTFWTFLNPADNAPRNNVQRELTEAFMQANPSIKIDTQTVHWAELASKVIQAVAAGKPPDVTRMANDFYENQYAAGTLASLDPYIAKLPASEKQDWVLDWNAATDKGVKRGIWIEHRVIMLWYRQDHLKEIGAAVPKTWDEMGKTGGKLTEKGHVGFGIGLGFGGQGNSLAEWLKPAIWGAGGDLVGSNYKATFNAAPGQKAFQLLSDLVYKYKAVPNEILSTDVDGVFQAIQASRVSMATWGSHRVVTARGAEGVGTNLQVAPVPGFTEGKYSQGHVTGWNLCIPVKAAHPEEAWKYIQFMTSTAAQVKNAQIAGELPSRKSAYKDPWFTNDAFGKEMMGWQNYINEYGRVPIFPSDTAFLQRSLVEAAQRIVMNKEPIKPVLDEAAAKYDANPK